MPQSKKLNAISLYITTCRYVIQCNPYDPESWAELYRYLPYLRQAFSCCVCTKILDIPMGPIENVCQHHVCKDCRGGIKRLRPACAWCQNDSEFVENSVLRIVIQCFKKLCEYLASSAVANNLSNASNGGTNALMTIIQEGMAIQDNYNSAAGSSFGLFPPKLQKETHRHQQQKERNEPREMDSSIKDKGQGQDQGSGPCTKQTPCLSPKDCGETSKSDDKATNDTIESVPCEKKQERVPKKENTEPNPVPIQEVEQKCPVLAGSSDAENSPSVAALESVSKSKGKSKKEDKFSELKNKLKLKVKDKDKTPSCKQEQLSPQSIGLNVKAAKKDKKKDLYETVAAEHDYNKDLQSGEKLNIIPKVRIRKIEGDHESLVKRPRLMIETVAPSNHANFKTDTNHSIGSCSPSGDCSSPELQACNINVNNNCSKNGINSSELHSGNLSKQKSPPKKKLEGCRCGLATPNPGKLTCCGQRCPCYSSFKGCTDCKCRGCRNPRGEIPGPLALKFQLQQPPQTFIGSNPQLILQPIKVEQGDQDSDIDIDI